MSELLALVFVAGVLVKIADQYSDSEKKENYTGIIFGLAYGVLLGYLMSLNIVLGTISIGIIASLIISNKFDSISHIIGLLLITVTVIFVNHFEINFFIVAVFFLGSTADEKLNDYVDSKKKTGKLFSIITKYRLITEMFAIGVAVALAEPLYWFAMLSFDFGYQITTLISKKIRF